jgi:molecular chaperone HtpG
MPNYLRFVRGLVDSNDLPLNVSREILQSNRVIEHIRSASVKKVLDLLESKANNDPEAYSQFWGEFGQALKEGPVEDFANRERLLGLLRFATTHADTDEQKVGLDDYIARMAEGQQKIWYVSAESFKAAQKSPHLEVFRNQGIEVLLLYDRVDEWLMAQVSEYQGYSFASVAKGELDFEPEHNEDEPEPEHAGDLASRIQTALDEQVSEVRVSRRLTSSPACLVLGEGDLALHMQHLLRQAGHHVPESKPALEINPRHPVLQRMASESDERLGEWSHVLLDQAVLAEGGQLSDPAAFVSRLNDLLVAWPAAADAGAAEDKADDETVDADTEADSQAHTG